MFFTVLGSFSPVALNAPRAKSVYFLSSVFCVVKNGIGLVLALVEIMRINAFFAFNFCSLKVGNDMCRKKRKKKNGEEFVISHQFLL